MSADLASDHARFGDHLRIVRNKLSTRIAVDMERGMLSESDAIKHLRNYGLCSLELAHKRMRTSKALGAYTLGYDIGRTLVEGKVKAALDEKGKWKTFTDLILFGFK
ncbi:MAG: hypothetical protein H6618_01315 [Deltaproteobacteria bacterium]|nr:hypothetical protein [Deltaproteobacteria bacterium]